ncbi:SDR family oxidoreductase [Sporolactobacillus sp. THM7-7]|nr:SDR family oxidoreductase [Sporolactobacillus sp. THM7-7]
MATTLITGASGGIGRETAKQLAKAGDSLYLHFNTGEKAVRELSAVLSRLYPNQTFTCVQADLAKAGGPERLFAQLDRPIGAVVYTCGHSRVGLFQDVRPDDVQSSVQLDLVSLFFLIQKLVPPMIHAKKGKIIIVSSIWGLTGASTEVLYSMTKGGQNTFVKALAKELAPSGITVNAVAPGAVDTAMMQVFSAEDINIVKNDIPAGRLARPEEIASLIRFLLSSQADYINGQIISANGAWYC